MSYRVNTSVWQKIGGIGAVAAGYQIAAQLHDESRKATDISTNAKAWVCQLKKKHD
ncbi:hypothetical protein J4731_19415 [Providencia rettgeri]|nr:hypothetical protein [Providencia rettgeri]